MEGSLVDNLMGQYNALVGSEPHLHLYGMLKLNIRDAQKVFSMGDQNTVLIHTVVGGEEKWSAGAQLIDGAATWNEYLHFNLNAAQSRGHPMNIVKLSMYNLADTGSPEFRLQEMGTLVFHAHDIIEAAESEPVVDDFELWGLYQVVGTLRLGVSFHYGEYGQGKSLRMETAQSTATPPVTSASTFTGEDGPSPLSEGTSGGAKSGADGGWDITSCFEQLYLGAAAADNEIKAPMAARHRHAAFVDAQSRFPSHVERLAYIRHKLLHGGSGDERATGLQVSHSASVPKTKFDQAARGGASAAEAGAASMSTDARADDVLDWDVLCLISKRLTFQSSLCSCNY